MNCSKVLEACVGPSLQVLEDAYNQVGITVWGNDIDSRWKDYYPEGKWIIKDILRVNLSQFDGVVFAPPLSRGCTGRREDALSINDIFPRYLDFLHEFKQYSVGTGVLVLPGKSMSSRVDRRQLHDLTYRISKIGFKAEVVPMTDARNRITKYYDIYFGG